MNLNDLGFDSWFAAQASVIDSEHSFARICAVHRGRYQIRNEHGEIPAEVSGKLMHQMDNPADMPCVGDWVSVSTYDEHTATIIHHVLPRKTFLQRKAPGKGAATQMIAANIDTALIIQSCHVDFNPNRIERYLVLAAEGQVRPVIILTKTDLITPAKREQNLRTVQALTSAPVLAISMVSGEGLDALPHIFAPRQTYCLLGSSGIGKTTLLNYLLGKEMFATKATSDTGEGVHTTTSRQLVVLEQGALLIDTPGMREMGITGSSDRLAANFAELNAYEGTCRFANCTHQHEPGCAVRAALKSGALNPDRYANYLKLKKESDFHAMSSQERRSKDRAFGRFVKIAKKTHAPI